MKAWLFVFTLMLLAPACTSDTLGEKKGSADTRGELSAIVYGSDRFVAVGSRRPATPVEADEPLVFVSSDGLSWTQDLLPVPGMARDIAFGNGLYVAVINDLHFDQAGNSIRHNTIATSSDAAAWSTQDLGELGLTSIAFGNGRFVIAAETNQGNVILSSGDGTQWEQTTNPALWWSPKVRYAKGRFIIHGEGAAMAVSDDGKALTFFETSMNRISWAGAIDDELVVVGVFDCCFGEEPDAIVSLIGRSEDGESWTASTSDNKHRLNALVRSADQYFAVSGQGLFTAAARPLDTLFDGFQQVEEGAGDYFASVASGTGIVVAAGAAFDGAQWNIRLLVNKSGAWTDPVTLNRVR